jgi:hypothetical protein
LQLDDTPVPAGQLGMRWREELRRSGPWRDYSDDPADMDYPTSYASAPRAAGDQPGYIGGFAPRPLAGQQQPLPVAPGRHAAARQRGAPRRDPRVLFQAPAAAAAPGFGQRMRAAARNHTGAAALTAAAVVGTGVGAGMFGFAPFATPPTTPAGVNAAMPAAAPPVLAMTGSATSVQHHAGHSHPGYLGKHRKSERRPAAHTTHDLAGSAVGAGYGAGTPTPAPTPQNTGSGGSAPAGSSARAPQASASSTPRAPSGGGSGSSTGGGSGTGSGHSGGSGHGGSGGLLGGVTGLLGGLGL